MTTKVVFRPSDNQIVENQIVDRVVTTKGLTTKVMATKWLTKVVTKLTINVLTTKLFTWSASTPPLFCESPPILPGSCQERFPLAEKECFVFTDNPFFSLLIVLPVLRDEQFPCNFTFAAPDEPERLALALLARTAKEGEGGQQTASF